MHKHGSKFFRKLLAMLPPSEFVLSQIILLLIKRFHSALRAEKLLLNFFNKIRKACNLLQFYLAFGLRLTNTSIKKCTCTELGHSC